MRIRISETTTRPFHNMWAMFDVVLLFLTFFLLTLRITDPEGVHEIRAQASDRCFDCIQLPDIHVELKSASDGTLAAVKLGGQDLGAGGNGLEALGRNIQSLCEAAGPDICSELSVVIEADFNLKYEYTVRAIGQCSMKRTAGGLLVPFGPRVRLATWNTVHPQNVSNTE